MAYKLLRIGVLRLADSTSIPPDVNNVDWQAYQRWLAAGNTPQPADPDPTPIDQGDLDLVQKQIRAAVNLMRIYCNAIHAGTYTNKTAAQTKADFKQVFDALP